MKILESYQRHEDARGRFLGITNQGEWREMNYLETEAGTVRGGHYHRETLELFYIIDGRVKIEIRDLEGREMARETVEGGAIVLIEPMEVHTFTALEHCRWINALSVTMDPAHPDIHIPSERVA